MIPLHIQEVILDKLDNKNKAICRIVNMHFNKYIGDVTPKYIKHQAMFINVIKSLIASPKFAFFNLAVNSSNFRMIVSDENNFEVYVYIIKKGLGGKIVTKNYKKNKCATNFQNLFKKDIMYGTLGVTASQLFQDIFTNLRSLSCASGKTSPSCFRTWKKYFQQSSE